MRCKKKDIIDSFIGGNGSFEGRLSFTGTVRIDGEFKGEINATGHLVVGTGGRIVGDVTAGSVVCSGVIKGNVVVEEYAEFRVPAKAYCELKAPRVVIEEGVVFQGSCRMRELEGLAAGKSAKVLPMVPGDGATPARKSHGRKPEGTSRPLEKVASK